MDSDTNKPGSIRFALLFSRRRFLGYIGAGAATLVGATFVRLRILVPPAFAQANCTFCLGPCQSCVSYVPYSRCSSPDNTCTCTVTCTCYSWESSQTPCYPSVFFAYTYCCNGCASGPGSGCGACLYFKPS